MIISIRPALAAVAIILALTTLTSACSGSREDVRVTLCKNLTSALMDSPQALVWQGNENRFKRPEYVTVKIVFELTEGTNGMAVCYYEYATVDENVMTQSQPLSAYSTLPYQMELNGELVAKPLLDDAVKSQQVKLFTTIMDRLIKRYDDAVGQTGNSQESEKW